MIDFEIIVTFENDPQIIIDLKVRNNVTEKNFISMILDELSNNEIKQLLKLSCMQYDTSSYDDLLPFIAKSNGKYYFNYNVNKDPITKKWYDFKKDYLAKRTRKRKN